MINFIWAFLGTCTLVLAVIHLPGYTRGEALAWTLICFGIATILYRIDERSR